MRKPWLTAMMAIISVLLALGAAGAADDQNEIRFTADQLEIDNQTKVAELSGNVRVTQGKTVITSRKLKLVFSEGSPEEGKEPSGKDSLKEIIALGEVHIEFEDAVAQAEEAVYQVAQKTLTLSGKIAKVTSQKNVISGSEIIMDRVSGLTKVIGGVEGVYFPADGKGIE